MSRCLLCKGFIRRARSTYCKRCGAVNVDPTVADYSTYYINLGMYRFEPVISGFRMAYRWKG